MAERNVTRAAQRVGMTQPAVSNALNRLRELVGDELFLRGVGGMRPTPRAIELAEPVGHALRQLQLALEPTAFDPLKAERTFRLAVSSHSAQIILPRLVPYLSEQTPGIALHVIPTRLKGIPELLDSHTVEFAIGVLPPAPERFSTLPLFEDRYVAVMRRDHPLAARPLSMEAYLAARQVMINPTGQTTVRIDEELQRRRLQRNVVMTVNQLLVGAMIVAQTDLITTVFQRSIEDIGEFSDFDLVWRPLDVEPVRIDMIWHPGLSNHPAHAWLRDTILRVSQAEAGQRRAGAAGPAGAVQNVSPRRERERDASARRPRTRSSKPG